MEKFRLINSPEIEEGIEYPKISAEEMEEVCSLKITDAEIKSIIQQMTKSDSFSEIIEILVLRNFDNDLPVEEDSFLYKRNLQECNLLRSSITQLVNKKDPNREEKQKVIDQTAKLFALERKKGDWVEQNYFPAVFGKAISVARAEVTQFLIKEKNIAELDNLKNTQDIKINLKDDLNYLFAGNPPDSSGIYKQGIYRQSLIEIRIPNHYTSDNAWQIYLISLHELLHHASFKGCGRTGIKRNTDSHLGELNEAVTEILTYVIAKDHLKKFKTPISGSRPNLNLGEMAYQNYINVVKNILPKIPLSFFTDAMLNKDGLQKLSEKFDEEFGKKDSMIDFANKLKGKYSPVALQKEAKVININDYKK